MQDEDQPWLIQPQSCSKTSLTLAVFVCYVLVVKRIILKTNFLFWIFLVVVYGFIYSHEREQIQDTKYQAIYQRGKVWNFWRSKRCSVLMVNAGKWCVKIKWRQCQYTIALLLFVVSLVFPTFSDFKVVYHEHPFAFPPSAVSVMPLSQ